MQIVDPIKPEVGKKYYAALPDVTIPAQPHALMEVEVLSTGVRTITLRLPSGLGRGTYHHGVVDFIEEWRPTPTAAAAAAAAAGSPS